MATIRSILTLGRCQAQYSFTRHQSFKLKNLPYVGSNILPTCQRPNVEATQCASIHSSRPCFDLMEFFDDKETWGEKSVLTGRPYRVDELRLKSNEDLHKLWYVLLKERNKLLTMQAEYERNMEVFPNPERIEKVEESMENILLVVKERDDAVNELETGVPPSPEGYYLRDYLGRMVWKRRAEYAVPPHMNKAHRLLYPKSFRRESLPYLALWREKIAKHKWFYFVKRKNADEELVKKFPHLEGKLEVKLPEEPSI